MQDPYTCCKTGLGIFDGSIRRDVHWIDQCSKCHFNNAGHLCSFRHDGHDSLSCERNREAASNSNSASSEGMLDKCGGYVPKIAPKAEVMSGFPELTSLLSSNITACSHINIGQNASLPTPYQLQLRKPRLRTMLLRRQKMLRKSLRMARSLSLDPANKSAKSPYSELIAEGVSQAIK